MKPTFFMVRRISGSTGGARLQKHYCSDTAGKSVWTVLSSTALTMGVNGQVSYTFRKQMYKSYFFPLTMRKSPKEVQVLVRASESFFSDPP